MPLQASRGPTAEQRREKARGGCKSLWDTSYSVWTLPLGVSAHTPLNAKCTPIFLPSRLPNKLILAGKNSTHLFSGHGATPETHSRASKRSFNCKYKNFLFCKSKKFGVFNFNLPQFTLKFKYFGNLKGNKKGSEGKKPVYVHQRIIVPDLNVTLLRNLIIQSLSSFIFVANVETEYNRIWWEVCLFTF
jgi:hypothetical protein